MRFQSAFFASLILASWLAGLPRLYAELPLPDATLYGKITTAGGVPVTQGALLARIERGGVVVLSVAGEFVDAEGDVWYVVRVPLETGIGAPGPSGLAAREGDVLAALLLDGAPLVLSSPPGPLQAGVVLLSDATGGSAQGPRYIRGDCRPDLRIDITDAVAALGYLFLGSAEPPCLEACDSDGSGGLDITDAVYTLSYLFLGGPPLPPPGPDCGVDPSPSALGCASSNCV